MNIKELIDGNNINANMVAQSPDKRAVIISAGSMKTMSDGKQKFNLLVEMNGKTYNYTPNKVSLQNISRVFTPQTENWVGKVVFFHTQLMGNGKDGVIATPQNQSQNIKNQSNFDENGFKKAWDGVNLS